MVGTLEKGNPFIHVIPKLPQLTAWDRKETLYKDSKTMPESKNLLHYPVTPVVCCQLHFFESWADSVRVNWINLLLKDFSNINNKTGWTIEWMCQSDSWRWNIFKLISKYVYLKTNIVSSFIMLTHFSQIRQDGLSLKCLMNLKHWLMDLKNLK